MSQFDMSCVCNSRYSKVEYCVTSAAPFFLLQKGYGGTLSMWPGSFRESVR